MDKGFIKLSRKFFSHSMWEAARTFSESEAWIDLIQSARFDTTETIERIGGRDIKWGRGQYPASNRYLAKKWGWGEQKVRNFLGKLKQEKMIISDKSQGMNILTLCKYDEYNGKNPPNNPPNNPDMSLILKELQQLKTQLATQQTTQQQPSRNPNKKKDKKEEKDINSSSTDVLLCETSQPHVDNINYTELVNWFNEKTKGVFGLLRLPLSEKRKGMIRSRIRDYGKDTFCEAIQIAYNSDFLKGSGGRDFKASFDWIIKPTNFEKIISGNYDNKNIGNNKNAGITDDFTRNIAEGAARAKFEKEQSDRKQ